MRTTTSAAGPQPLGTLPAKRAPWRCGAAAVVAGFALLSAGPAAASPFAYVVDAGGNSVSQYDATSGALAPLSPATVGGGFNPHGVAVSPDGRSVYVGESASGAVAQYSIGADGTLTAKTPATVASPGFPAAIAVSADGNNVYAANQNGATVSQFSVGAGGTLTAKTPATVTAGTGPSGVAVSPDGQSVYVTNNSDGTVSQYSVGADGTLSPKTPATVATAAQPVGVAVSPDGQSVYVASRVGNTVSEYSVGTDGTLTPKTPASVVSNSGAYDLTVSPDGQSVYVVGIANTVSQFSVGTGGTLTPKTPSSVLAGGSAEAVAISRDGHSVYVANRGTNNVSQYSVGADGTLTADVPAAVSAGAGPVSVAVSPTSNPVAAPPTVSISSPVSGATYAVGQIVSSDFTCTEGAGGPGISSCRDQNNDPSGTAINTSTPGIYALTGTATSGDGQTGTQTVNYTVAGAPTASITTPSQGATYTLNQVITAGYACSEGAFGPGLLITGGCVGTIANGATIDTSAAGQFSFTVTATSQDGQSGVASSNYSVGYASSGLLGSVNNPPTVNTGKGGRTYAVKFQLTDANGQFITGLGAIESISYKSTACTVFVTDPTDAIETTATGGTGLRYDSTTNQYVYNWASPGAGCYTLFIKLVSGQVSDAYFKLS
jgi:6-phosphogluconolactonase (cycloisomerase 2 family)